MNLLRSSKICFMLGVGLVIGAILTPASPEIRLFVWMLGLVFLTGGVLSMLHTWIGLTEHTLHGRFPYGRQSPKSKQKHPAQK